jgi:hypothetical protein
MNVAIEIRRDTSRVQVSHCRTEEILLQAVYRLRAVSGQHSHVPNVTGQTAYRNAHHIYRMLLQRV